MQDDIAARPSTGEVSSREISSFGRFRPERLSLCRSSFAENSRRNFSELHPLYALDAPDMS